MRLALLLVGLCPVVALSAQQPRDSVPVLLEAITVTAERRPPTRTVSPVRVVESGQIDRRANYDLATLLRDIPGLQLDPVVGSGLGISIQGLGSDRVLILLDGTPMPGRISNEFDVTRIDGRVLERIEVIEGPQSTLYGSSALGGVINFVTRNPRGRRVELASQGGSFGHLDLSGRVSATLGTTAASVDLARRSAEVVPGLASGSIGTSERWNGMVRMVRPLGGAVLNVRAMHTREDQDYLSGAGVTARQSLNRNVQTDLLATWGLGGSEMRAHFGSYDHTLRSRVMTTGVVTDEPQIQTVVDVEALRQASIGATRVVVGVRGELERTASDRLDAGVRRNLSAAVYASGEVPVTATLALSGGARTTVAEAWGTNIAPRLGLVWTPGRGAYAKVGAARGFRAPSFLEQFADYVNTGRGNYAIRGNADLVPERSWNVTAETGLRVRGGELYLRGYVNQLRDFIETEQVGTESGLPVFSYRNVGRARTQGAEAGGRYTRGVTSLSGSYAWLDTEDELSGRPLLGRAAHTVRAALAVEPGPWSAEAEFVRNSAVPVSQDRATGGLVYEGAAPRLNLRGSVAVSGTWRATGGVDNVGNVVPERAVAGLGRRWFAGLSWGGDF